MLSFNLYMIFSQPCRRYLHDFNPSPYKLLGFLFENMINTNLPKIKGCIMTDVHSCIFGVISGNIGVILVCLDILCKLHILVLDYWD